MKVFKISISTKTVSKAIFIPILLAIILVILKAPKTPSGNITRLLHSFSGISSRIPQEKALGLHVLIFPGISRNTFKNSFNDPSTVFARNLSTNFPRNSSSDFSGYVKWNSFRFSSRKSFSTPTLQPLVISREITLKMFPVAIPRFPPDIFSTNSSIGFSSCYSRRSFNGSYKSSLMKFHKGLFLSV